MSGIPVGIIARLAALALALGLAVGLPPVSIVLAGDHHGQHAYDYGLGLFQPRDCSASDCTANHIPAATTMHPTPTASAILFPTVRITTPSCLRLRPPLLRALFFAFLRPLRLSRPSPTPSAGIESPRTR